LSKGEVELMSGVCLVPALGHTTADCVVKFGSDSWQAIFLAYTHPCLLASSTGGCRTYCGDRRGP
jgi:hypothetical protein